MAQELKISASLNVTKNGANINSGSLSANLDMAGDQLMGGDTQNIGTAWEALTLGDIAGAPGMLLVKNLDPANYVELAYANDGTLKFAKIIAKGFNLISPESGTIYAKANTAAVNVQKWAAEA